MDAPIPAPELNLAVSGVTLLCLAALAAGILLRGRELLRACRFPRGAEWPALLLALCGHAVFLRPQIPQNIWHEQYGVPTLLAFERGLSIDSWWNLHGPAFDAVMFIARHLTGGALGLFSLNYLFSLASVVLLFLLLRLLSELDLLALTGALLLLFLPAHLRISLTESRFVLVETFSLLSLLFLAFYGRTRRAADLALCAAAALVVMHLRAEMMALVPAAGGAYWFFLRRELRPRAGDADRALGVLAGAAALALPRAAQVLSQASPRITDVPTAGRVLGLGITGLTPFFDPRFTPLLLPALAAAGAVFLFRRSRPLLSAAGTHWALFTVFYARHSVCVSHSIRFGTASLYLFAAAAACGLTALCRLLPGRWPRRAGWCACLLLPLLPLLRWDFLTGLYTQQAEFRFLQESAALLPARSVVAYLSNSDDPGAVRYREHQRLLLEHASAREGKTAVLLGIRQFLALRPALGKTDAFFFAGADCYRAPSPAPGAAPFTDPLCSLMRDGFELAPLREVPLTARSLRPDSISGDRRPMGLYRILRISAPPEAAPGLKDEAGFWLSTARAASRVAALAEDDGPLRKAARAALRRAASSGPDPEQARSISLACQRWGLYETGLRLLDSLVEELGEDAGFRTQRGTLRAMAGDRAGAVEDLEAALTLQPGRMEAALTLGGLHAGAGRRGEALAVYEAALRARPRTGTAGERKMKQLIEAERDRLTDPGR